MSDPPATSPPKTCWVLTEGHAGMEGQCIGLAENLGLTPVIKRVSPKSPWIWLPARLWPNPVSMAAPETPLTPPWPDILISCGRRSAAAAAEIKRQSGKATLSIHLQVPRSPQKASMRSSSPNTIISTDRMSSPCADRSTA